MGNRPLDRGEASRGRALRQMNVEIDRRHSPRSNLAHHPRAMHPGPRTGWPEPAARIVGDAGCKRSDEQLDRRRTRIVAAVTPWLIHDQLVPAHGDAVAVSTAPGDGQFRRSFR